MPSLRTLSVSLVLSLPAVVLAQGTIPLKEEQIAAAVLPLPSEQRASARVLGYDAQGKLVTLREGKEMVCLANDPKKKNIHVACYHESMEPFMARGRALRASGVTGDQVDSVRFREVRAGTLKLPKGPAMLYSLTGGAFNARTGKTSGAEPLFVTYIPFATSATSGLSEKPVVGAPWIMYAGTPKAHIMFTPSM